MKSLLTSCCAAALLLGTAAFAQDTSSASKQSQEVQKDAKTTTGNKTAKVSTDTIRGRVETFEAGKTLKVTVPGKLISTKSFDLDSKDWTYHVTSNLKQGDWVTVTERTDNNGHKTLTVRHATQPKTTGTSGQ